MFSEGNELDFRPGSPDESFEEFENWGELKNRIRSIKDRVQSLGRRQEHLDCPYIDKNLLVEILRTEQRPELVYWILRSYAQDWAEDPVIETDRGKTIYIDFDRDEENLSVYIGESSETICISSNEGKKYYVMDVLERIDFLLYSSLGVVLKRQFSGSAILELARRKKEDGAENEFPQPAYPSLIYSTGPESACTLCTDWVLPTRSIEESDLPDDSDEVIEERREKELLFEFTLHLGKKSSWVPGFESLNF